MGRIVVHQNVTLDGVVQDPTGEEGFERGGWFERMPAAVRGEWAKAEFQEAKDSGAWLIGRRTYHWFAQRWGNREGEWADRLRSIPKYVVSSTLDEAAAEWVNTRVVKGDLKTEAARVRDSVDGDVVVYGSRPLVQALFQHDLVDELRLMTHPFVLGDGERLFGRFATQKPMELVETRTIGGSLVLLTYRSAGSNLRP